MKKVALITGITGQDGAYLAKFLLNKDYKVYGTFRRVSQPNFYRLEYLNILHRVELIPFDLLDQSSMVEALKYVKPDEIYNLAAQSYVGASFEQPVSTGEITGLGVTRLLDTVRQMCPNVRLYQASSSEMFGNTKIVPQNEQTPFCPSSPYAAAKLYAHWLTVNYRKAYNLFACCGILFNHESPLRGLEFVTRKITYNAAKIKVGLKDHIKLGNLDARRDWGFAQDYVEAMWLMLQQDVPDDYVIATGNNHSVRDFFEKTFEMLELPIDNHLYIDKSLLRPTDVENLLGDPTKAVQKLGWNPRRTSFEQLIEIMVEADVNLVNKLGDRYDLISSQELKVYPHFKE